MTRIYITIILTCFLYSGLQAQITSKKQVDEYSGFEAGLNVGAYFGNKNTANFYNGAGNEDEMNRVDRILNNEYHLADINEVLNQEGFRYPLVAGEFETDYPQNMNYQPAIYAGLTGRYWLNRKVAISASMNYSKLVTNGVFQIITEQDIPSNKESQYILGNIAGEESVINIDLGLVNSFPIHERMNFIFEVGFNLNNTTVLMNKIEIYDYPIDIKYSGPGDYVPNGTTQYYEFRQGGIGYGAYATPGLQIMFADGISADILSQFYYSYISLEHYSNWGLQWAPYVRFNFTGFFM